MFLANASQRRSLLLKADSGEKAALDRICWARSTHPITLLDMRPPWNESSVA